ncbi:four helix bundle protein [Candidatus Gottesmanbacteria bacterium]|nr:four helix bundle protein [Candidatus Gottesmanbacteria bacterium]
MTYIKSYKELIVWQKSIELVKEVYILTNKFPKSELYGIVNQMRRAAISIPSNIAEGYGRSSIREYKQSFSIAYGSALELETQIIISKKLQFMENKEFSRIESLLEEVLKMLNKMLSNIRNKLSD